VFLARHSGYVRSIREGRVADGVADRSFDDEMYDL
jgi:hypothetical protein